MGGSGVYNGLAVGSIFRYVDIPQALDLSMVLLVSSWHSFICPWQYIWKYRSYCTVSVPGFGNGLDDSSGVNYSCSRDY